MRVLSLLWLAYRLGRRNGHVAAERAAETRRARLEAFDMATALVRQFERGKFIIREVAP